MTHERNIAHVRQFVGRSVSFIIVHSENPIWRTSKVVERSDLLEKQAKACLSSRRTASFVPRRGASYFRSSSWKTVRESRSSEIYIFPRSRLSSFHSDYLRRRAVDQVVERSRKKYVCTFPE